MCVAGVGGHVLGGAIQLGQRLGDLGEGRGLAFRPIGQLSSGFGQIAGQVADRIGLATHIGDRVLQPGGGIVEVAAQIVVILGQVIADPHAEFAGGKLLQSVAEDVCQQHQFLGVTVAQGAVLFLGLTGDFGLAPGLCQCGFRVFPGGVGGIPGCLRLCQSGFGAGLFRLCPVQGIFGFRNRAGQFAALRLGLPVEAQAGGDGKAERGGFHDDDHGVNGRPFHVEEHVGGGIDQRRHGEGQDEVMHRDGAGGDEERAQPRHHHHRGQRGEVDHVHIDLQRVAHQRGVQRDALPGQGLRDDHAGGPSLHPQGGEGDKAEQRRAHKAERDVGADQPADHGDRQACGGAEMGQQTGCAGLRGFEFVGLRDGREVRCVRHKVSHCRGWPSGLHR